MKYNEDMYRDDIEEEPTSIMCVQAFLWGRGAIPQNANWWGRQLCWGCSIDEIVTFIEGCSVT